MDANEATKVVFSRIQALDPDNASKIMGFIFIQDPPEHEMLRLATGPETTLISLMNQAKTHLGILSNTSSAPSPRIIIPNNNGFHVSPSSPSSPWPSGFSLPVPDQLDSPSFDPIVSPSGRSDSMIFPSNSANIMHRRSFSVNDAYAGGEEGVGGFGWRPCMYYARGFCKNGGNCKFLHGGAHFGDLSDGEGGMVVGSPGKIDGFDEVLRMKAFQQQQRLSQLMGGGGSFPYNKGLSFLNDSPRSAAAALMMGDEFHKFARCRSERSDFSAMGLGAADSSARQIYLTFPADSTFKEEDVSNYFSTFGPVQDVRIPYQQKRMFGFVTFVYPETVKMILAKGNPHFVCDSRVLVKPYKEKGKILEKRQHQLQFDRGDFAGCLSPTGLDSRESYDFPIGPRILNNHEMMRRKLEHAEIQQALELQGRRLMNLHLMDLKNHHHQHHHANQFPPPGTVISSPVQSHLQNNHSFLIRSQSFNHEISEDIGNSLAVADGQYDELPGGKEVCDNNNTDANGNDDDFFNPRNDDLPESLEHILPDNLFSSPTKSAGENGLMFSSALSEGDSSSSVTAVPASTITSPYPLNKASPQPCYSYNMPRFVSRQEADEV